MATNFAGLGSGLDINTIISQLISIERQPITRIKARQDGIRKQMAALEGIGARVALMSTSAAALASPAKWGGVKVTSSDTSVATASATGSGASGTLQFSVTNLASSHAVRSNGTLSATSDSVTAGSRLILGTGLAATGISSLRTDDAVTTGAAAVLVTRASAPAVRTGATPVAGLVVIDPSNDTFFVDVNGVARSVTLAHGSYDRSGLVSALNAAYATANIPLTASSETAGSIALTTGLEGSSASIMVTGGTSLAALGMAVDTSATTGVDGLVSFRGVETTVTAASANSVITLNAPDSTTVQATLSGGLRIAEAKVGVIDTGSGSLRAVVDAVNAGKAHSGVTAAAVRVGTNAFRLQLSSLSTGGASTVSVHAADLAPIGTFVQSSAAADATLTVGSGEGSFTVASATNSFADLLDGVSVTAVKTGAVTVTSAADTRVSEVKDLITKANTALGYIADQSRASTTAAGALSGDATVRSFASTLRSAITGSLSGRPGISVDRNGLITFDATAYETAYNASPTTVRDFFSQSASGPANVAFSQASDSTIAGTYSVSMSQAATKATVSIPSWASSLSFTQNAQTVAYAPSASASAAEVVAGLNSVFSTAGLALEASVASGAVAVSATAWGTLGAFSYTQGTSTQAANGLDVAGSIDGVVATGVGQLLSLPTTATSSAAGLRLVLSGTTLGSLGNVIYATGMAGRIRQLSVDPSDTKSMLYSARTSRAARVSNIDSQVVVLERRVKAKEDQLRRQYAAMDSTVGRLQNVSSWLAQQANSMSNNN